MKYIKKYKTFESANTEPDHYLIKVDNKGYIIDNNYNLVDEISNLFDNRGEFSEETENKTKKYNLKISVMPEDCTLYFGNSLEDGIDNIKKSKIQHKEISDYLTPEKTQELLDLFKK